MEKLRKLWNKNRRRHVGPPRAGSLIRLLPHASSGLRCLVAAGKLWLADSQLNTCATEPPMQATEDQILQLERKALDRWSKEGAIDYHAIYADDVTYFDPLTRARIDGLKALS